MEEMLRTSRSTAKKRIFLLLWLAALSAAVHGGEYATPAFDCEKADERAERIICSFEDLAIFDQKLAKRLQSAGKSPLASSKQQANWVETVRNRCTTPECLRDAYRRRIASLDSPTVPAQSLPPAISTVVTPHSQKSGLAEDLGRRPSLTATTQANAQQSTSTNSIQAMPGEKDNGAIRSEMPSVGELSKSVITWLLILPIVAILVMFAMRLWRTMPEKPAHSGRHDSVAHIPGIAVHDTTQGASPVDAMIGMYQMLSENDQKEFRRRINHES